VAATFAFTDASGETLADVARLDTMVTVVDAGAWMHDFNTGDDLAERGLAAGDGDERTISDLLVDQVEFANVIVLNKTDRAEPEALATLEKLLWHMNPDAVIVRAERGRVPLNTIFDTRLFDFETAATMPGWIKELRGEHIPETLEYGISSFVYRATRPFHPSRLMATILAGFDGVVRSKGWVWLASRGALAAEWSLAGGSLDIRPAGFWPEGDAQQEMVFIGVGMDQAQLTTVLDAALLTDAELAEGAAAWSGYHDPFPAWPTVDSVPDDDTVVVG